jgi:hypothetical protein
VVEQLPSKREALSSNPSTRDRDKERERKRERKNRNYYPWKLRYKLLNNVLIYERIIGDWGCT